MNERIRQLARQANLLGPTSRVGNSHEATERFAELIIKECLDFLEVGRANGLYIGEVSRGIKQHFGVEE